MVRTVDASKWASQDAINWDRGKFRLILVE